MDVTSGWVICYKPFDKVSGVFISKIQFSKNNYIEAAVSLDKALIFDCETECIYAFKLVSQYMETKDLMRVNLADHSSKK